MPAPIVPAPMTATVEPGGSAAVIAPFPSSPGEARRSFRDERGDAFAIIVAVAQRALQVALEVELRGERVGGGRLERLLDRREPARGRLGEVAEQPVDDGRQLGVLDALAR